MSDIRLNGRMVNFSKLTFKTSDPARISAALDQLLGNDYKDSGTMVVVDSTERNDVVELFKQLRTFGLQPFAVVDGVLTEQAQIRNIPVLSSEKRAQRIDAPHDDAKVPSAAKRAAATSEQPQTLTSAYVLRTGQSMNATQGDLVLFQGCNRGSESFAKGNIHVYGNAQGRLIAGVDGNTKACIFCQNFNPELISIAGTFSLSEDLPANMLGKSVFVSLNENNQLVYVNMTAELAK